MKTYLVVLATFLSVSACNCGKTPPVRHLVNQDPPATPAVVPPEVVVLDGGDTDFPVSDAGEVVLVDAGDTTPDAGEVVVADAGVEADAGGPVCVLTDIPATGSVPDGMYRLDGAAIGTFPTFSVGSGSVTITAWVTKDDEANQLVGFSYTSTVPVGFAVKAGLDIFTGNSSPWLNPNGTSGSDVAGISNITFEACQ